MMFSCFLLVMIHTILWLSYQLQKIITMELGTHKARPVTTMTCVKVNPDLPIDLEKQQQQVYSGA
jgi:hypothetical protein